MKGSIKGSKKSPGAPVVICCPFNAIRPGESAPEKTVHNENSSLMGASVYS